MIQVCCYRGCGVVYGEKEPLSDKRETHGLCPKHYEIYLKEMRKMIGLAGGLKVLIVEDSPDFLEWFREKFRNRFPDIEIYEATNAKEALQAVETSRPHLIFMDIGLPDERGIEVTKKIKARHPDIIVMILTGYDSPEYREASLEYADYFFSKTSMTEEIIFTLVESVLPTHG